jgi:hypothetical protein
LRFEPEGNPEAQLDPFFFGTFLTLELLHGRKAFPACGLPTIHRRLDAPIAPMRCFEGQTISPPLRRLHGLVSAPFRDGKYPILKTFRLFRGVVWVEHGKKDIEAGLP